MFFQKLEEAPLAACNPRKRFPLVAWGMLVAVQ